jgi:hypothetical protein
VETIDAGESFQWYRATLKSEKRGAGTQKYVPYTLIRQVSITSGLFYCPFL